MMRRGFLVVLVLALCMAPQSWAQQTSSCLPNELRVNQAGNGTVIAVTNAAPVKVVDKDLKRCQLAIVNTGGATMHCMPAWQGAPSVSAGVAVLAGGQLLQNTSGRGEWYCIATTATPTTALVLEEIPNVP